MRYFAYGSNMLSARLRERVPSASAAELAWLSAYRLEFNKLSLDGSGKANILSTGRKSDRVYGVLYSIDDEEQAALDAAEEAYEPLTLELSTERIECVNALSYTALRIGSDLRPYRWYRDIVVAGAKEHGLPATYLRGLHEVDTANDPDPLRRQKHYALIR